MRREAEELVLEEESQQKSFERNERPVTDPEAPLKIIFVPACAYGHSKRTAQKTSRRKPRIQMMMKITSRLGFS